MACIENVLGRHGPSPIVVTMEKNGTKELCHELPLQRSPNFMPEDDSEKWGRPRNPLRPPFSGLNDLAREQLERPAEKTRSCIPDSSGALRHPYVPPPAVVEESLATIEVNSSQSLGGQRQKGQNYVNVSQEAFGGPQALMVGGTRASRVGAVRGDNSARPCGPFPRGQGFFLPRGQQVRGPPYIPTLISGIMMEVPPGNPRTACSGRLAHVSFPAGAQVPPVDNRPRPMPLLSSAPGLPCSTHGFMPPPPLNFKPFLSRPIPFVVPPAFGLPMSPYFAHLHARRMPPPASSNREFK